MFTIGSFLTNDDLTTSSLWSNSNALMIELYKQAILQFPIQGVKVEQIINFPKSKPRLKYPGRKCWSAFSVLSTLFKY